MRKYKIIGVATKGIWANVFNDKLNRRERLVVPNSETFTKYEVKVTAKDEIEAYSKFYKFMSKKYYKTMYYKSVKCEALDE